MTATPVDTTPARTPPPPDAPVVVRCASLSKIFRDFWLRNRVRAVDAIDMDIRQGEVFGLLGPNGSGKSTTIKMMLGLLKPTSGRIAVFGKPPEDVATKKIIGYLPEESYLYRFLNARETLDYYARLFHQGREQRRRRVDMLLEMVGLEAVQRRPVGEYSKGMQRRIGLAQALINDPQLLILDEPTTGLDPIGTRQIKDIIVALAARGKTILLCSHLLADVEDVCDRVSIMYGGKVRAEGTVASLLTRHDTTTLQTETLDDETIRQIKEVLTARGKRLTSIEQPRQKLESLFLDIVQRAQAEGLATSGARSDGKLAEFLVHSEAPEGDAVIRQLMRAEPPPAAPAATPAPVLAPPQPINQVIENLSPPPAPPAPIATATTKNEPKPDLSVLETLISPGTQSRPVTAPAPVPAPTPQHVSIAEPAPPPAQQAPAPIAPQAIAPTEVPAPLTTAPPAVEAPPPPPPVTAKIAPAPTVTPPPLKASESGEKPDESFIKALQNVPPFKGEDEDKPGQKK
ncbi:MAG: ABC transporter ATP-binding protein [Planctomycetes bacterium]|nr:ABC transporter ATP-binding protein [Planctomycetota bacterium]